jgi:tRNA-uridine 2-sulfurtransferase
VRIVVGMSGGVDSAVSALLLKQQGHDVVGVFMKNWEEQDENGVCAAENDWNDVRDVCAMIGVPHYSVNFAREYRERVFSLFLDEYRAGRTPNPDVLCNREIKFKAFLDFAMQLEADKIATGHFVQTDIDGHLLRGADRNKDQSYFLYMLKSRQLQKTVFPVGDMTKAEVRAFARGAGLPVAAKKDSTGICFIGERNFREFLKEFLPAQPGDITTQDGERIGRHDGLMYYTLGQRRGLGIGGRGDGRSFFVVEKDLARNILVVAQGGDHPLLYSRWATVDQLTWVCAEKTEIPTRLDARFRYRQQDQKVTLTFDGDGARVVFDQPQRAVTPGQSAVFYNGDECLGGGIIRETFR